MKEFDENVGRALLQAMHGMSKAIAFRDAYTANHQAHVSALARSIGQEIGLSSHELEGIRVAGNLHDIGKIGIPGSILNKTAGLSNEEYELIKTHAKIGAQILDDIDFPWPVRDMVFQHHERIDGSGYPQGLEGDAIIVGAQILGLADTVNAIVSHRAYCPARPVEAALDVISDARGALFDPCLVDACIVVVSRLRDQQPLLKQAPPLS